MIGEERVERTACKGVGDGVVVDGSANEHHCAGEHCGETHAHLVEDDAGKDEEEDKHIEECLRTGIVAEGLGCPSPAGLQKTLQGREDIHEDVGKEHRPCQQYEGSPAHGFAVT